MSYYEPLDTVLKRKNNMGKPTKTHWRRPTYKRAHWGRFQNMEPLENSAFLL